jgi:hypothetical protein
LAKLLVGPLAGLCVGVLLVAHSWSTRVMAHPELRGERAYAAPTPDYYLVCALVAAAWTLFGALIGWLWLRKSDVQREIAEYRSDFPDKRGG